MTIKRRGYYFKIKTKIKIKEAYQRNTNNFKNNDIRFSISNRDNINKI